MNKKSNNQQEKRAYPRFAGNFSVQARHEELTLNLETKNISCSGFFCEVDCFIPVMTKFSLTMFLPLVVNGKKQQHQIDCSAVVVRIEPEFEQKGAFKYKAGFFFSEINDSERQLIARYIQQAFWAGAN
ncbi:MAG: hypothetical protein DRP78_04425 [Candidatus Omnitrophota bacterium]|nr:MAG: hypothetical protein DRP78_04425 [Candidatus Omnitrophota bacterium]